jgi:hypothetical protein
MSAPEKIQMEQRATIRFLTLKVPKAKEIQIKHGPRDEYVALEIGAVENGDGVSCKAKSTLEMIHNTANPPSPIVLT